MGELVNIFLELVSKDGNTKQAKVLNQVKMPMRTLHIERVRFMLSLWS